MKAWTDYPFTFLGDTPGGKAPVRECEIVSYDNDKYCRIIVGGHETEIKAGYIYEKPGRWGEVPAIRGGHEMIQKPTRWQSKKYRDAARGQDCKLRFPGCRNEVETVVLCHRPGSGMGTKASDHDAADGCVYCHNIVDRRQFDYDITRDDIEKEFNRARLETIINRVERGVIK